MSKSSTYLPLFGLPPMSDNKGGEGDLLFALISVGSSCNGPLTPHVRSSGGTCTDGIVIVGVVDRLGGGVQGT